MQYSEFVKHVQQRTKLEERAQTEALIKATIETLADRLSHGEPANLAAQLPEPIKSYLSAPGVGNVSHKYSVVEFIEHIAARAASEHDGSEENIKAVLAVLAEAVSPGEMHDVRVRFPPEYIRLFGERDTGGEHEISA